MQYNAINHDNIGKIKRTAGQIKKHYTQMTDEELDYLASYMKTIKSLHNSSPHFKRKIGNQSVDIYYAEILKSMHAADTKDRIIEYNETPHNGRVSQRVLLKLKDPRRMMFNGKMQLVNLFAVISLEDEYVITCYANAEYDEHITLRMDRYNNNLKIREICKGGYPI